MSYHATDACIEDEVRSFSHFFYDNDAARFSLIEQINIVNKVQFNS